MCEGPMRGKRRDNINAVKEGVAVEKVFFSSLPPLPVHLSSLLVWGWTKSVIVATSQLQFVGC